MICKTIIYQTVTKPADINGNHDVVLSLSVVCDLTDFNSEALIVAGYFLGIIRYGPMGPCQ